MVLVSNLFFIILFSFSLSFADETKTIDLKKAEVTSPQQDKKEEKIVKDPLEDINQELPKKILTGADNRANKKHSVFVSYTPIDTWVPSKLGINYSFIESRTTTWDVGFDRGSIGFGYLLVDIASISDQRFTLLRTSYGKRNSFFLTYGLNYYKFSAHIGSKRLAGMTGNERLSAELINIESLGLTFGIGNRWQRKNWIFGINWVSIHVPVVSLKAETGFFSTSNNPDDEEHVRDIIDTIKSIPTFSILKLHVGYSF